jgi:hypothetical protein
MRKNGSYPDLRVLPPPEFHTEETPDPEARPSRSRHIQTGPRRPEQVHQHDELQLELQKELDRRHRRRRSQSVSSPSRERTQDPSSPEKQPQQQQPRHTHPRTPSSRLQQLHLPTHEQAQERSPTSVQSKLSFQDETSSAKKRAKTTTETANKPPHLRLDLVSAMPPPPEEFGLQDSSVGTPRHTCGMGHQHPLLQQNEPLPVTAAAIPLVSLEAAAPRKTSKGQLKKERLELLGHGLIFRPPPADLHPQHPASSVHSAAVRTTTSEMESGEKRPTSKAEKRPSRHHVHHHHHHHDQEQEKEQERIQYERHLREKHDQEIVQLEKERLEHDRKIRQKREAEKRAEREMLEEQLRAELELQEREEKEQQRRILAHQQQERERVVQEQKQREAKERQKQKEEQEVRERKERRDEEKKQKEVERIERRKQEQMEREMQRRIQEKIEREQKEQERREQMEREKRRKEQQRLERERQERERLEWERREQERIEKERREQERQERERRELERREQERLEIERREIEQLEHQRREAKQREMERKELERREMERRELERREMERKELERREMERRELERRELERKELERRELERRELERKELERREMERREMERREMEKRRELERRELERTRKEQERLEAEEKARREKRRKDKEERERRKHWEAEEAERVHLENLEREARDIRIAERALAKLAKEKAKLEREEMELMERERLGHEMAEKERFAKEMADQERKVQEEKAKSKSGKRQRRSSYDPRSQQQQKQLQQQPPGGSYVNGDVVDNVDLMGFASRLSNQSDMRERSWERRYNSQPKKAYDEALSTLAATLPLVSQRRQSGATTRATSTAPRGRHGARTPGSSCGKTRSRSNDQDNRNQPPIVQWRESSLDSRLTRPKRPPSTTAARPESPFKSKSKHLISRPTSPPCTCDGESQQDTILEAPTTRPPTSTDLLLHHQEPWDQRSRESRMSRATTTRTAQSMGGFSSLASSAFQMVDNVVFGADVTDAPPPPRRPTHHDAISLEALSPRPARSRSRTRSRGTVPREHPKSATRQSSSRPLAYHYHHELDRCRAFRDGDLDQHIEFCKCTCAHDRIIDYDDFPLPITEHNGKQVGIRHFFPLKLSLSHAVASSSWKRK